MTMNNTAKRIFAGCALAFGAGLVALCEYFGIHAVRYATMAVVVGMIFELAQGIRKREKGKSDWRLSYSLFIIPYSLFLLAAAYFVGARPWIVLLLLMTISFADIGAWLFGKWLGGDKMWERLSAGKTWSGQIAGILCGTFAAVMYGLLGTDTFLPQLMWIGIGVSLLSQYGDLTASWLKRKLGVKDFGTLIPGHGGLIDRFDGWIYVLPIIWLVML